MDLIRVVGGFLVFFREGVFGYFFVRCLVGSFRYFRNVFVLWVVWKIVCFVCILDF